MALFFEVFNGYPNYFTGFRVSSDEDIVFDVFRNCFFVLECDVQRIGFIVV